MSDWRRARLRNGNHSCLTPHNCLVQMAEHGRYRETHSQTTNNAGEVARLCADAAGPAVEYGEPWACVNLFGDGGEQKTRERSGGGPAAAGG